MKALTLTILAGLLLVVTGCMNAPTINEVPLVSSEKIAFADGDLDDPSESCTVGYQKVYYVLKDDEGDRTVLALSNCLETGHADLLKAVNDSERTGELASVIDQFRIRAPDLN